MKNKKRLEVVCIKDCKNFTKNKTYFCDFHNDDESCNLFFINSDVEKNITLFSRKSLDKHFIEKEDYKKELIKQRYEQNRNDLY